MRCFDKTGQNWPFCAAILNRKTAVLRPVLLALVLTLAASSAQAKTLLLTCQDARHKYEVTFDTISKKITTTHRLFSRPVSTERFEEHDDEHLLVWGVMDMGNSKRNFLAHFGRERWVKHFTGYSDVSTDDCL